MPQDATRSDCVAASHSLNCRKRIILKKAFANYYGDASVYTLALKPEGVKYVFHVFSTSKAKCKI